MMMKKIQTCGDLGNKSYNEYFKHDIYIYFVHFCLIYTNEFPFF